jgi:hypothetical protein
VSGFAAPKKTSINDIVDSLERRGFWRPHNTTSLEAIQTQVDAVLEELGEVARLLRRDRQGREDLDMEKLANEGADLVISSTCLLAHVTGYGAPIVIADKLTADEKRGWLHSGMSREEYEKAHDARIQ